MPDPIPFPDDTTHASYDPAAATRFWRALTVIEPVFAPYRAAYQGKVSRVQFFWGSADLAVTRFSGEPCTPPPGADLLDREAYDYEQMSVGLVAGRRAVTRSRRSTRTRTRSPRASRPPSSAVAGAAWNTELGEFILDYDDVRAAPSPEAHLRAFLDAAYDACATRSNWDPASPMTRLRHLAHDTSSDATS